VKEKSSRATTPNHQNNNIEKSFTQLFTKQLYEKNAAKKDCHFLSGNFCHTLFFTKAYHQKKATNASGG